MTAGFSRRLVIAAAITLAAASAGGRADPGRLSLAHAPAGLLSRRNHHPDRRRRALLVQHHRRPQPAAGPVHHLAARCDPIRPRPAASRRAGFVFRFADPESERAGSGRRERRAVEQLGGRLQAGRPVGHVARQSAARPGELRLQPPADAAAWTSATSACRSSCRSESTNRPGARTCHFRRASSRPRRRSPTRIIPALAAEGIEWAIVDSIHFERATRRLSAHECLESLRAEPGRPDQSGPRRQRRPVGAAQQRLGTQQGRRPVRLPAAPRAVRQPEHRRDQPRSSPCPRLATKATKTAAAASARCSTNR